MDDRDRRSHPRLSWPLTKEKRYETFNAMQVANSNDDFYRGRAFCPSRAGATDTGGDDVSRSSRHHAADRQELSQRGKSRDRRGRSPRRADEAELRAATEPRQRARADRS